MNRVDAERMGPPAKLAVVTATGYAYERDDGVSVAPIGVLGPSPENNHAWTSGQHCKLQYGLCAHIVIKHNNLRIKRSGLANYPRSIWSRLGESYDPPRGAINREGPRRSQ